MDELEDLLSEAVIVVKGGGLATREGKTNVLVQAYISRLQPRVFALVSDSAFVAQESAEMRPRCGRDAAEMPRILEMRLSLVSDSAARSRLRASPVGFSTWRSARAGSRMLRR